MMHSFFFLSRSVPIRTNYFLKSSFIHKKTIKKWLAIFFTHSGVSLITNINSVATQNLNGGTDSRLSRAIGIDLFPCNCAGI